MTEHKLNYNVDINNLKENERDIKDSTKLSMQSTVSSALASKMPMGPAQPAPVQANSSGWGVSA
jgi:hypothetical protein